MKFLVVLLGFFCATIHAQNGMENCPMHKPDPHAQGVDRRGDSAMGFSHEKTTHHFRLLQDGGVIEVEANGPDDAQTRDRIRAHLAHVARMFSLGDFDVPMFIHDRVPPGVPEMKKLGKQITYDFVPTDRGGLVRLISQNARAVASIHDFLRFQIADHRTGDSVTGNGELGVH